MLHPSPPPPIISIDRVTKRFQSGGGEVVALREVSVQIAAGEFVSLIGPSGCGKSTLLRLVGDLESPDEGTLWVKDKTPQQARLDREYGIAFQSPVLFNWRTVRQNVELPLEIMGRADRRARAQHMLALVGLQEFAEAYPWQLSGGMQQRVAIARALSFDPAILLMDEPFGALDEMTRERLQGELLNVWGGTERETTVLFVTHSIQEAVFLSDRVVVMSPRPGRIERIVLIDLPRPRTFESREDPHFFELVTTVREALWGDELGRR